jgi:creatinine amidohydrolase
MQWEHLTASEFSKAVRETNVCIIAFGVMEKHSEHLPLGTDFLNGHAIACQAAEREPAIVFPPFYFGQIYEARCFPGAITIKPALLMDLIQSVFEEIRRNGIKKIILYNAHGGNDYLLPFIAQCHLWEEHAYHLYLPTQSLTAEAEAAYKALRQTSIGGHACEMETDTTLGLFPELVKMERIPKDPAAPLGCMNHLPPTFAGISWYSDYPEHYAGDARPANRVKGEKLVSMVVDFLAMYIAAVKADQVVPALEAEFYEKVRKVGMD